MDLKSGKKQKKILKIKKLDKESIIEIRKTLNLTQERFARALGTTVATVNRWENGKFKPSSLWEKEILKLK